MTDVRELDWMIGEGLREIHRDAGLRELVDHELYMGGSSSSTLIDEVTASIDDFESDLTGADVVIVGSLAAGTLEARQRFIVETFTPDDNIWVAPSFAYHLTTKAAASDDPDFIARLEDAFIGTLAGTPFEDENKQLTIGSVGIGKDFVTIEFVEEPGEIATIFSIDSPEADRNKILYFFTIVTGTEDEWEKIAKKLSAAQVTEIAEAKVADMNTDRIDSVKKMVAGTARSMGVEIEA